MPDKIDRKTYLSADHAGTHRQLSPELQALVGYSIYPPFMGMVDGKHPLRTLELLF